MGRRLIHTGNDAPPAVKAKGGLHLVAVAIRLIHTHNGPDRAETSNEPLNTALLEGKLLLIAHIRKLAAAAFFPIGARRAPGAGFCLFHSPASFP